MGEMTRTLCEYGACFNELADGDDDFCREHREFFALRQLRDAVGVFMACNEPLSERYHNAKVKVRKAYEKAKVDDVGK